VTGGRVWYRIVGAGSGTPLLTLHGGPGLPSDYLAPLEALADARPVIFYDQLGCGRSERPDTPALWHVQRFVDEVATVCRALGLDRYFLFGHSWGSMLAIDYALTRPPGLRGLVLASPCSNVPRYLADQARLFPPTLQVPDAASGDLSAQVGAGTASERSPADDPAALARAFQQAGLAVYHTMWGPSETCVTGNLADYDRTPRLGEIEVPTLFTCGRFDQSTPESTAADCARVPEAELVVFEHSGHMPHLDEPEAYVETLHEFLDRREPRAPRHPA
jgi:proline iminopeptidase